MGLKSCFDLKHALIKKLVLSRISLTHVRSLEITTGKTAILTPFFVFLGCMKDLIISIKKKGKERTSLLKEQLKYRHTNKQNL